MNLSIEFDSNPEVVMVICKKKKKERMDLNLIKALRVKDNNFLSYSLYS